MVNEVTTMKSEVFELNIWTFGSIILILVAYLTWHEVTMGGKDIILIFFGSRIGIDLGITLKVIYCFLIGFALLILRARKPENSDVRGVGKP